MSFTRPRTGPGAGGPVVPLLALLLCTACGGVEPVEPATAPSTAEQSQPLSTLLTCPVGSSVITYDPPLRNVPQDVVIDGAGTLSNCYSLLGARVTSASDSVRVARSGYTCQDLLAIPPGAATLTWNTGEQSVLRLTQVLVRTEGLLLIAEQTGTVLSGKFEGSTVVRTTTFQNVDLGACASEEGLAEMRGLQVLTLLGPT